MLQKRKICVSSFVNKATGIVFSKPFKQILNYANCAYKFFIIQHKFKKL